MNLQGKMQKDTGRSQEPVLLTELCRASIHLFVSYSHINIHMSLCEKPKVLGKGHGASSDHTTAVAVAVTVTPLLPLKSFYLERRVS